MWLHKGSSSLSKSSLFGGQAPLPPRVRRRRPGKITDALLDHAVSRFRPGIRIITTVIQWNECDPIVFDELFARDQFEERPLIWKAHVLRQQKKLDDAEKTIRQAIAIDPSDGEEGRGDRMRAYAELADILDAQGNQKRRGNLP